jgi:hypothetical protein
MAAIMASAAGGVGAAHGAGVDVLAGEGGEVGERGDDVGDLGDPGDDLDAVQAGQEVLGEGAGGDAADGLAGGGPAAAGDGAQAEFGVVGVVGVRGSVELGEVVVVVAAGVAVADQHGDRGAEGELGFGLEAAQDLDLVGLLARAGELALAGAAAGHLGGDAGEGEGVAGGAAVDDHAEAAAVGLAEGGDAKGGAEGVAHGGF